MRKILILGALLTTALFARIEVLETSKQNVYLKSNQAVETQLMCIGDKLFVVVVSENGVAVTQVEKTDGGPQGC